MMKNRPKKTLMEMFLSVLPAYGQNLKPPRKEMLQLEERLVEYFGIKLKTQLVLVSSKGRLTTNLVRRYLNLRTCWKKVSIELPLNSTK